MVVCSECCDTDLCSASGCHSPGKNTFDQRDTMASSVFYDLRHFVENAVR